MRTLQRHHAAWAGFAGLAGVTIIASFTPNYRPLAGFMQQRYLESQDRADWQIAQRAANAKKAADEKAAADRKQAEDQQRALEAAAEQERARLDNQHRAQAEQQAMAEQQQVTAAAQARALQLYPQLIRDYHNEIREPIQAITTMLSNIRDDMADIQKQANKVDFYQNGPVTPEETSTDRACADPMEVTDLFSRSQRRARNVYACAVFLSLSNDLDASGRIARNVTLALWGRLHSDDGAGYYPLQTILTYIWINHLTLRANAGQVSDPLPPLIGDNDQIDALLIDGAVTRDFAQGLIETATIDEKLTLRNATYPLLQELSKITNELTQACQVLQRSPCIP